VWNELADWYLESTKSRLASGGDDGEVARAVLAHSFDAALRLLQPIVPFITDVLWRQLPVAEVNRGDYIARAMWPTRDDSFRSNNEFELVREAVNSIRQLRADYAIPPGDRIQATLESANGSDVAIFTEERDFIGRIARCDIAVDSANVTGASILLSNGSRLRVPLEGVIDIAKECHKATAELEKLESQLNALNGRLGNPGFTDRAPAHVVEAERAKQVEWSARREALAQKVASLCGK
jgi:valyl-tRNA synthetase